jgi:anti-anti-sigma regulatory factor
MKGVLIMACNFKILTHRNCDGVHLKLIGDFDGSSAHELLNNIKTYSKIVNQIFIHTNGLKDVHPFGKAVFHNNFNDVNKREVSFIFTGEYGNSLAPWKKESVIIN